MVLVAKYTQMKQSWKVLRGTLHKGSGIRKQDQDHLFELHILERLAERIPRMQPPFVVHSPKSS